MPKATAVWLVENTSLSFEQIAEFCGLHVLEVKGIADGDVAQGIKGMDPISNGQLSREEILRAEKNPEHRLRLAERKVDVPPVKTKPGPRYTPVSRRQDRPNAVLWLLRNHPEMKDSQIIRLVGTTKPTIAAIRDRTHWNSNNLVAQDPVALGLCSQIDLDTEVQKAATRLERERADQRKTLEKAGATLLPTSETVPGLGPQPDIDLDAVFAEPAARPARKSEDDGDTGEAEQPSSEAREDDATEVEAHERHEEAGESEQPSEDAAETEEQEHRDEVKSDQT
jgi:hypothetical protein